MYASVENHPSPTCSDSSTPQTLSRTPFNANLQRPHPNTAPKSPANQIQRQPRVSRRPAAAHADIELPSSTYEQPPSRLRQLSDKDIHSPRVDLFRQTRCHLLHLRVKHEHTPSTWLIQDRATTAPILLLLSKDTATSSSEYFSNSAYIQQTCRTDTPKTPIRLPATSAAATGLWIPSTTAAASMGPTAAAAAIPATVPPAAPRQLRPGNDAVPIAAGADV